MTQTTSATTGRRTFPACAAVTVDVAGQRRVLTGREAALVAELVLAAPEIAGVPFGTVHLDLRPNAVQLRLEALRQVVRVSDVAPPEE